MTMTGHDSLKTRRTLKAGGRDFDYYSLPGAAKAVGADFSRLPLSLHRRPMTKTTWNRFS